MVHLVAQRITDLSADLASVGSRDAEFPLSHGRGDQVRNVVPVPIRASFRLRACSPSTSISRTYTSTR